MTTTRPTCSLNFHWQTNRMLQTVPCLPSIYLMIKLTARDHATERAVPCQRERFWAHTALLTHLRNETQNYDDVMEWKHFRSTGPLCGEFTGSPHKRPVTQSFDVFFDVRLNKRLSKQSWCWWFETPSRLLWRHRNDCLSFEVMERDPLSTT